MTKEDIKKAATEYANEACRPLWRTGYKQVCMVDFMEGAKWRISNAWHDVNKELPEYNKHVVNEDWFDFQARDENDLKRILDKYPFKRWAYVEDLKPNMEE